MAPKNRRPRRTSTLGAFGGSAAAMHVRRPVALLERLDAPAGSEITPGGSRLNGTPSSSSSCLRRLDERTARDHRSMAHGGAGNPPGRPAGAGGPPRLEDVDAWRIDGAKALTDELLLEPRSMGRP
jgi:hypothetical protein